MNIDKKFLLVCLQLIIVLVMSMIVEGMLTVDAPIESSRNPLQQILYRPSKGPRPRENRSQRRAYRLFHHCSAREVVIHDKVSTTRNTTDMHGDLVLESMMKNGNITIRIRGWVSQNYVCYNRRGRLIAKPSKRARGGKCEFFEELRGGSFRYRSVYNEDWVLGFTNKGQPIPGPNLNHTLECFKFNKTPTNPSGQTSDHLTRHHPNIVEHNRRIGTRTSGRITSSNDSSLLHTLHSMRHSKKSHRHRNRRPRFQRTSADR